MCKIEQTALFLSLKNAITLKNESAPEVKSKSITLSRHLTMTTLVTSAQKKLARMLELQDRINTQINPEWRSKKRVWKTAIWTEMAELMGHLGWEWWKKTTPDLEQARLELVDVWHFVLSYYLEKENQEWFLHSVPRYFASDYSKDDRSVAELTQEFVGELLPLGSHFPLNRLVMIMSKLGLTLDELYRQYLGKFELNGFRQKHGYKEGTYRKKWFDGREDNHLSEILQELKENEVIDEDLPEFIYLRLAERYDRVRSVPQDRPNDLVMEITDNDGTAFYSMATKVATIEAMYEALLTQRVHDFVFRFRENVPEAVLRPSLTEVFTREPRITQGNVCLEVILNTSCVRYFQIPGGEIGKVSVALHEIREVPHTHSDKKVIAFRRVRTTPFREVGESYEAFKVMLEKMLASRRK